MDIKNVVIGLPETGKTTFLAALWHVVESKEILGSLILQEYPPERGYIEKLKRKWLELEPVGRTSQSINQISMKLTSPADNVTEELVFPDVSGELYREEMLKGRVCSIASHELFKTTSNLILFVNPDRLQKPLRIDEADASTDSTGSMPIAPIDKLTAALVPATDAASGTPTTPWKPDIVPTQVQMVELLQLIASIAEKKFGIAVVISAWDRIPQPTTPSDWLRKELPLLHQFLISNEADYRYKSFGVSAFGGDPAKDVAALGRKHTKPSDRIIVQDDSGATHHDITAPIRWLIFKDGAI